MTRWLTILAGLVLAGLALVASVAWFTCRIYVPEDRCAVIIRKMGASLPVGQLVATQPGQKGIQEAVLGPGRHFLDPLRFDWEFQPLTIIPAGDPKSWEWVHSPGSGQRERPRHGGFHPQAKMPMLGVVTRKVGREPPAGQLIVRQDSGERGILAEVLTPGTYKLNPYIFEVELHPAVVIPAGFVGVVTNLFGEVPRRPVGAMLPELDSGEASATSQSAEPVSEVRPLAQAGQRGTLRDVLQPGVYFINPKLQKVTLVEIGFNEYSQTRHSEQDDMGISFPSDTGYLIQVGVTVVWGINPRHAAEIINEFGNIDGVLEKVIGPQIRSICRNLGSTYSARDFIQGEKRELFQKALTAELQRICRRKNIEVLLALVREIEVQTPEDKTGQAPVDLKRTIQESYVAIERQLTKQKQREAATVRAQLEEVKKQVDIAREQIRSQTNILVANIQAEGEKLAAELDAQAGLEVATIQQEVAGLDARRAEILGQARADVDRMKKNAEAEGYRLLVEAFGSPKAYNLYTFAENFQPESIRMIFAGEGTFWTDLSRFEEVAAAKLLKKPAAEPRK
jgi:regulator of protease activity HflC (stomatin/prohibitin superfamily)